MTSEQVIIGLIICAGLAAYAAIEWCVEYIFAHKDHKPAISITYIFASAVGTTIVLALSWLEFFVWALVLASISVVVILITRARRKSKRSR